MTVATDYDAVVVGGSFAGACAAAALSQLGWSVLLCEPGLADERRLAGELLQAPAVSALESLGLLDAVRTAGAVPSCGFAICPPAPAHPIVLSYGEIPGCRASGLAIEHTVLARALLAKVTSLPGVSFTTARVTDVDGLHAACCRVELSEGEQTRVVTCRLIVAADGSRSRTRELAGITVTKAPPLGMLGCKVSGVHLPCEGYGHVFIGGRRPVLVYRVSSTDVRLMFEREKRHDSHPHPDDLAALPSEIAAAVATAFERGEALSAIVSASVPERFAIGRLVLVGDAGGAVHPVTATGAAFCANDALRLARALVDTKGRVETALALYDLRRREPMQTRALLAPLIAETLGENTPAMRVLRAGLFSYWRSYRAGRAASLGLLSTHEQRRSVLLREYATVVGYAVGSILRADTDLVERAGLLYSIGQRGLHLTRQTFAAPRAS